VGRKFKPAISAGCRSFDIRQVQVILPNARATTAFGLRSGAPPPKAGYSAHYGERGAVTIPVSLLRAIAIGLFAAVAAPAVAQQRGGPTPAPAGASVYFIGLKDGATIAPKTTIHFGLRGMGVAPAGSDRQNAGHHHLLVDTDLPPLDQPIPNDFNHLHYGARQTEAEVNLSPGPHTLQLLLGDKDHVPHSPPVMSERIRVVVAEAAPPSASGSGTRHASPAGAQVYFEYPKDGGYVKPKVRIRFGLVKMGVAPAGVERPNTGHHHLLVDTGLPPLDQPIPNDPNHLHFGAGQTEAEVTLPLGTHTLQLLLGDNDHVPHDPPVMSRPIKVTVTTSGRKPRPSHRRRSRYY
jgi:Domain of unknown function (DUF4399)